MKNLDFDELVHPTSKQREAFEAVNRYKYVLYGGAMGGGKSYWLRWCLIKFLLLFGGPIEKSGYEKRGVRVGMFCEDYPSLKDRQISKIKYEFPSWLGESNESNHEFTLKPTYGSGVICFRNLDEPSKYGSAEFATIAIDELTKNKKETFGFLRTRLRWPGIKDTKFIAGTNPGGIGHDWVKKLWIDRIFDPNETEADQFFFVPAKVEDNPHLDSSYFESLKSLPEDLRKAYVEGDWDLFAGQYFKEFRKEIHICPFFNISFEWKKFICGDYGYSAPSAVYWCAINPDGQIFVYRELYEAGLTHRDLAQKIKALTPGNEAIKYCVFDPSIFAKSGATGEAGADAIKREGLNIIAGDNNRIAGWAKFRDYLKPYTGQNGKQIAKLQIFETCPNLIRTLPQMIFDKSHPEDLDSQGEDHSVDAIRYGLMSLKYEGGEERRSRKRPRDPRLDPLYYWKVKKGIYQNMGPAFY